MALYAFKPHLSYIFLSLNTSGSFHTLHRASPQRSIYPTFSATLCCTRSARSSNPSCTDTRHTTVGFTELSATPNSSETNLILQHQFQFRADPHFPAPFTVLARTHDVPFSRLRLQQPAKPGPVPCGTLMSRTAEMQPLHSAIATRSSPASHPPCPWSTIASSGRYNLVLLCTSRQILGQPVPYNRPRPVPFDAI